MFQKYREAVAQDVSQAATISLTIDGWKMATSLVQVLNEYLIPAEKVLYCVIT